MRLLVRQRVLQQFMVDILEKVGGVVDKFVRPPPQQLNLQKTVKNRERTKDDFKNIIDFLAGSL